MLYRKQQLNGVEKNFCCNQFDAKPQFDWTICCICIYDQSFNDFENDKIKRSLSEAKEAGL